MCPSLLQCNQLLVDHCGSSAVLCTATQPLLHAVDKTKGTLSVRPDSELMLDVESLFADLKRVEVLDQTRNSGWSNDEIAQLACHELKESRSCLVIVNTKKLARALFSLCIERNPQSCFHLSTNMCPAHRLQVLKEVRGRLHRNEPVMCVSTQLIEAGVDVDFGSVIRCFAGLDSIAQAAGRCNRNGKQVRARVHIVNAIDDATEMLKDIQIGKQKAERVLGEFKKAPSQFNDDLLSPAAIQRYFQYYFFDRADEMAYRVGPDDVGRNDNLLNLLSTNRLSVSEFRRTSLDSALEGNLSLPQSFMAAAKAFKVIDSPTYGIIVPYGTEGKNLITELCRSRDLGEQRKLLRKAQHYTADLYLNVLEKLRIESALYEAQPQTGILYLDERYYSKDFGACTEAVSDSAPLIF
jgi:CRISPR-associated endonuclease/helicase Cas3